ncbi:AmmeMemoRadiSam system protein A [Patescibacteria group bacterium]
MKLFDLTKQAVESFIKEEKIITPPDNLPDFLKRKAGVFVTIKKNNELRGCVGTYLPTKENIAKEIIHNAIAAATRDYRFDPIQKEELPDLVFEVYILNKPELVNDIKELNPKKFGIIVKINPVVSQQTKIGLLLPDLKGIDTVEKQVSLVCQKARIDPIKENIIIYKFSVEKYAQK